VRSKLFVPGSRPELFAKALARAADGLSFDLEDSVAPERKSDAREAVRAMLLEAAFRAGKKTFIVRINPPGSAEFPADIAAVVQSGLDLVNLPKTESADEVRAAAEAIEKAERANGVREPVRLLLNIESARALRIAHELALAHERVAGLQLGLGDLFEPLGISRRDNAAIGQAMFAVRMAAGASGKFAYDSAFGDIQDEAGFREEAQMAKRLGFLGKSCIHPSQIASANAVFRPSDEEIAHAVKVLSAAQDAQAKGLAAYVVDGKMIDPPFLERARAIAATASRMGLLPGF
jgi:citrate lyase subunit beta/citryl-CoA lyase